MGKWGGWSKCETSCKARDGTGNRTRTRSPAIEMANGGNVCTEETSEGQACSEECPSKNVLFDIMLELMI